MSNPSKQSFTMTFSVDQTPDEVFRAIQNVRGWWGQGIEGDSEELGDEFHYRHKDIHDSRQKLIEVVPGKKVVWLVLDAELSFTRNTREWKDTRISFEISRKADKTELRFTHLGLDRGCECFAACSQGWSFYAGESLRALIVSGKGQPDAVEYARWPRSRSAAPSATP